MPGKPHGLDQHNVSLDDCDPATPSQSANKNLCFRIIVVSFNLVGAHMQPRPAAPSGGRSRADMMDSSIRTFLTTRAKHSELGHD